MPQKNNPKVLLVEDDPNLSMLFSYELRKGGYECQTAANGSEGYELAELFFPDIIISDVMMPEVNGFEFREMLLKNPRLSRIPFVFLTSNDNEDDQLRGYDLEIAEYIPKTIGRKIIQAKISAILKNSLRERSKVINEIKEAAGAMGASVVPDFAPGFKNYELFQWHRPFDKIPGGDFIDYHQFDDDNMAVILGDVMGKRWGAWYFAYAYAGYVRSTTRVLLQTTKDISPANIIARLNEAIFKDERISDTFITLSIVTINNKTMTATYSGAGDLPLYLFSDDVKPINSDGKLIGIMPNSEYSDIDIQLKKDDCLFMITDGIIEGTNENNEMLGNDKFVEMIRNVEKNSSEKNELDQLRLKYSEYTQKKYTDDISLIMVKAKM
ncbi:MAG: SpoIIE family protein phosphatase [Melioribacteraceae bacterium]|nr:SpoIIE family protein phosphatase [Melioribacteraceae bacterium]MCF8356776.1 SpoIIE family protein phosphatase [Melioribacteraceae bacterium]MCF8396148.1 SpoIIE family protein phosphatase [Melioribacteraceae bacterium]MCF8421114.1 SpoIIE family protein phosphatase [Melioribacteraceae bacterium]